MAKVIPLDPGRVGRPLPVRDSEVNRLARALGSYAALGALCGVSRSRVSRWELPSDKGGSDGFVPECHRRDLRRRLNQSSKGRDIPFEVER